MSTSGGTSSPVAPASGQAGPPIAGAHQTGELSRDTSGNLWVCTAGGTPGTWKLDSAAGGRVVTAFTLTAAGQQLSTTRDVFAQGAIQNNSAVAAVALNVQISPDGVTWTSAQAITIPTTTVGSFREPFGVLVPAGWQVRADNLTNAVAVPGAWY